MTGRDGDEKATWAAVKGRRRRRRRVVGWYGGRAEGRRVSLSLPSRLPYKVLAL